MRLDALYHCTPRENRSLIYELGLQVNRPVSDGLRHPDGSIVRFPWICLATTPEDAWQLLSRGARGEHDDWDVWQVWMSDHDRIEIRGDLGLRIREVRVMHGVGPDRLWLVGTRGS